MTRHYARIYARGMDALSVSDEEFARVSGLWLCVGCHAPRQGTQAVEIHVLETRIATAPLYAVFGLGIGAIRRDVVEAIGEDVVRNDLYLGTLTDGAGKVREDWFPFIGKHRIFVRGRVEGSRYRICDQCGRVAYASFGKDFLFPAPPDGACIWDKGNGGLVVIGEIADRLRRGTWKRLGIEHVRVQSSALDGYPELTSCEQYPTAQG